jgi:hypothetical protein
MNRNSRHRHHYHDRRQSFGEALEARFVLSGGPLGPNLSIIGTSPAPGATLASDPSTVTFTFDRPLFDGSQGFTDFQVDLVNGDGSLTPMIDPNNGAEEDLSPDGTQVTVVLDQPLGPGTYELVLSGMNELMGQDGTLTANALAGTDQTLGTFTVIQPGVTLAQATDLGTAASTTRTVSSTLDLSTNPLTVQLYKFTLTPDHFWRVGAEISAHRIGSPLNAALTLFDADGHPIKSSVLGRPDAPGDPYLFSGLSAGTYYLGVSADVNRPGLPGAYDPSSGNPGSDTSTNPGGPFTLRLAADPADAAPAVLGVRLDHANPLDAAPTGFDIQFNTPMDVIGTNGTIFQKTTQGLEVLDQSGRSWPIAAIGYDESQCQLTYIFRQRLPQGKYSVVLPPSGGLSDLAGHRPIAAGHPAGVLATFVVGPNQPSSDPTDLGSLFPQDVLAGLSRQATVAPGATATFHYANLYADFYKVGLDFTGGPVQVSVTLNGAPIVQQTVTAPIAPTSSLFRLPVGDYYVRVTNLGTHPTKVSTTLTIAQFSWESLLENGIGQGPALSLRLVSPTPDLTANTDPPAASPTPLLTSGPSAAVIPFSSSANAGQPTVLAQTTSNAPGAAVATNSAGGAASGGAGVLLTFGGVPVGLPTSTSSAASGSAPGEGEGVGAIASTGLGVGAGLGYAPSAIGTATLHDTGGTGAVVASVHADASSDAPLSGALADRALEQWVGVEPTPAGPSLKERLNAILASLPSFSFPDLTRPPGLGDDDSVVAATGVAGSRTAPAEYEEAGFNHSVGYGLAAVLLLHSHNRFRRWATRGRNRALAGSRSFLAYLSRGEVAAG